jgi:hypothetical protein
MAVILHLFLFSDLPPVRVKRQTFPWDSSQCHRSKNPHLQFFTYLLEGTTSPDHESSSSWKGQRSAYKLFLGTAVDG